MIQKGIPIIFKKESWDSIAKFYGADWLKEGVTGQQCKEIIRGSIPSNSQGYIKILDNACGTGSLTLNIIEILAPNSNIKFTIDACDYSPKMVEQFDRHIQSFPSPNGTITSHVMDGQNLEFPDETFDYAYSMFGLVFFASIDKGLQSMNRVLKSGGTIGISSWSYGNFIQSFYDGYKEVTGHEWNGEDLLKLSKHNEIKGALEKNGFVDIKTVDMTTPIFVESTKGLFDNYIKTPVFLSMFETLSPEQANLFEKIVIDKFDSFHTSSRITINSIIAIAKKP
ncbi:putative SAM dependent methyltransferase [Tieghemostelium lacteum]|uniref:Putative SAM dependent methyltransferase n=1 Tax=Tieghemostelium lacteum TaxID=361077 RepID=A0A151ZSG6_TIELA|nr:putative SAM dependent methyltransferase [Tieghemostelium lacteum]|eukprot:KYQ96856.1 putative SAM dependent methyltransferase [Tieghemostelium lacteum]